jgi:putative membrane protein insertion efficiency factor
MIKSAASPVCHSERSEKSSPISASGHPVGFFAMLRMTISGFPSFLISLPARSLLTLIRVYQRTLSPALPALFGSACGCRFAPTCSHYAADAVREHGALAGTWLATRRLVKCTPLHPGGFDPVPARRSAPRCGRATA